MGFFDGPEYPTGSAEEQQRARLEESLGLLNSNPELQDRLRVMRTELGGFTLGVINQEGKHA